MHVQVILHVCVSQLYICNSVQIAFLFSFMVVFLLQHKDKFWPFCNLYAINTQKYIHKKKQDFVCSFHLEFLMHVKKYFILWLQTCIEHNTQCCGFGFRYFMHHWPQQTEKFVSFNTFVYGFMNSEWHMKTTGWREKNRIVTMWNMGQYIWFSRGTQTLHFQFALQYFFSVFACTKCLLRHQYYMGITLLSLAKWYFFEKLWNWLA